MRYAKALGLAAIAAMALTAFVGVASASASNFKATVPGTALTGEQVGEEGHVFITQGQKVTCEIAKFTGNAGPNELEPTQTVHPEYKNCEAFGFEATVDTEGCLYKFGANTTGPEVGDGLAMVGLEKCTKGHVIILVDIGIATCEVQVPNGNVVAQNADINGQEYKNVAGGIEVVTNSTNIISNVTRDEGLCPLHLENGAVSTYTGHTLVTPAAGEIEWVE